LTTIVEVERSLRVLDGAVGVVDAVKGVEAQTETVWKQCNRYGVPRVAFVNKMDRDGASFDDAVASLRNKLGVNTLVVQLPLGEDRQFRGMVDLIDMSVREWNDEADATGSTFEHRPLSSSDSYYDAAMAAREALITQLCELDEKLMDAYLTDGITSSVFTPAALRQAIRQATISLRGVAVLCGASLRNKGVQPLLDAIVDYLPAPSDRQAIPSTLVATSSRSSKIATASSSTVTSASSSSTLTPSRSAASTATIITLDIPAPPNAKKSKAKADATNTAATIDTTPVVAEALPGPLLRGDENGPLCALAFKVSHDPQTGPLVFVRVYSGTLKVRDMVVNSSAPALVKERPMRVLEVHADSSRELA
jgi:translation elongation factor EF-G